MTPVLDARALSKRYGATVALNDVSFALNVGEICGLLGENGAGKSTLVKVLSGVTSPDTGEMRLATTSYRPRTINDARRQGVATAFQELSLVPTLSVAINLFLPSPALNPVGLVARRRLERDAASLLADYDITEIDPAAPIADLPLGQRQRIEIVRAMFRLIACAVTKGTSILYISHKLDEIRRLCSRCIILRNGYKVLDSAVVDMGDEEIFRSMAGRSAIDRFVSKPSAVRAAVPPALCATHLIGEGVDDISFSLQPGEILGVAGLEGHGQSRLFKSLVGLYPLRSGRIEVGGVVRALRSPRAARAAGVVLVPEERKSEGIFKDLTTIANISLPVIERASAWGFLSRQRERALVGPVAKEVDLPEQFLSLGIMALSGGNQQKAVLGRALTAGARCLLLFDPTRGVDVGAKESIYRMMCDFVQDGGAILFYSTELDELVHLCDRCLVLYRNRIVGDLPRAALTQEQILSLATGHTTREAAQAAVVQA
jgi:ribose transport system ATP-binding protein